MRIAVAALAAVLMMAVPAVGQVPPAPPAPSAPAAPAAPAPTPGPAVQAPVIPPPVVAPAPLTARTFLGKTGLIFNAVRPERTVDFELVMGYLQAALAKSADATVRAQAEGWRVFKATEPGPNGTALYVFVIDPAVPGAEYGLGRILSDAYPDQIQEIWKLYTGSLAGGGSLLNLTPVTPPATLPTPPSAAPVVTTPAAPRPAPPAGAQPAAPQPVAPAP